MTSFEIEIVISYRKFLVFYIIDPKNADLLLVGTAKKIIIDILNKQYCTVRRLWSKKNI